MDDRANYFRMLKEFTLTHRLSELPERHRRNLAMALEEKDWRNDEVILKKLHKASKLMVKNGNNK